MSPLRKRLAFRWRDDRRTFLWPDIPLVIAGGELLSRVVPLIESGAATSDIIRDAATTCDLDPEVVTPYVESIHAALASIRASSRFPTGTASVEAGSAGLAMATLNLTRACNLRCRHCYAASRVQPECSGRGEMTSDEIEHAIARLATLLVSPPRLLILSGGEPTLVRSKLERAVRSARNHGLTPRVNTNGHAIDPDLATLLAEHEVLTQVSLDGVNNATHALLRCSEESFERALTAIRTLVAAGCRVRISFTVHKTNVHHLPDMLTLADAMGAEQMIPSSLVRIGNAALQDVTPVGFEEEFSTLYRAVKDDVSRQRMTRSSLLGETVAAIRAGIRFTYCGTGLSTCCVDSDGSVYPCINMVSSGFVGGHINDPGFLSRWADLWPALRALDVDSLNARCAHCFCRYFCGGYCRGETLASGKGISDPYVRCRSWQRAIVRVLDFVSETPDLYCFDGPPVNSILHRE